MFRTLTLAAVSILALGAPMAANAGSKDCPPGLAKKSPACEAPGQAKKHDDRDDKRVEQKAKKDTREVRQEVHHKRGDRIPSGYVRVSHPERYGLGSGTYYHRGGDVIRVDPDTQKILAAIGLINALTN
ncbi:excinuclease ABC subunit A [Citreicella sp. C3M06]|uniref:excinuclease ABC subunit A n=1 Tax=Citreicella sp. C3M06 TaxID=2841564 RepID=UPI001C0855FA|nr:excinuclease ABC subunit A [Citreicella sp. C3M06]MBU2962248.1 excinuclease ABC subunit A [Citreicella sp. C3M06]